MSDRLTDDEPDALDSVTRMVPAALGAPWGTESVGG